MVFAGGAHGLVGNGPQHLYQGFQHLEILGGGHAQFQAPGHFQRKAFAVEAVAALLHVGFHVGQGRGDAGAVAVPVRVT